MTVLTYVDFDWSGTFAQPACPKRLTSTPALLEVRWHSRVDLHQRNRDQKL